MWDGKTSEYFPIENGVRQGGILSPVLFTIYMDGLMAKLENSGLGCHIGENFYGALCYADDLTLICPSVSGLQEMVNMCDKYGEECDVKFNEAKTVCITFSRKKVMPKINISLGGKTLRNEETVTHLGVTVHHNLCDELAVRNICGDIIWRVNGLLGNFKRLGPDLMCVLLNQQCIHLYRIENCVIQDKIIHPILVTWSKAVRSIWNLPNRAHSNILPILSGTRPLQEKIKLRAVSLIEKMKTIENCKTRSLVEQVKDDRRSISYVNSQSRLFIPVCDVYKGQAIRELSECLWGRRYLDGFGQHEILELIEWISVL